jgi:hypothetical protein
MKALPTLLCLGLLFTVAFAIADQSKYSGEYLELNSNPNPFSDQHILEFWGYHNTYEPQSQSDTLKLRYYQPLQIDQWRGTMRLDTSYVSAYGPLLPNQSSGTYTAGNTLLTIWGNHPGILQHWNGTLGGRIVFPFGNNGQWAAGPQVGMVFHPTQANRSPLADFSPLARYMYGFYLKNTTLANALNQPALARRLELYPTIGLNLAPQTQLRFWDENGIVYNSAGGGWFVPIDAMVTHRLNQHFLFAVGVSKQVVQTYQQYDWSFYGKLSFNF